MQEPSAGTELKTSSSETTRFGFCFFFFFAFGVKGLMWVKSLQLPLSTKIETAKHPHKTNEHKETQHSD